LPLKLAKGSIMENEKDKKISNNELVSAMQAWGEKNNLPLLRPDS